MNGSLFPVPDLFQIIWIQCRAAFYHPLFVSSGSLAAPNINSHFSQECRVRHTDWEFVQALWSNENSSTVATKAYCFEFIEISRCCWSLVLLCILKVSLLRHDVCMGRLPLYSGKNTLTNHRDCTPQHAGFPSPHGCLSPHKHPIYTLEEGAALKPEPK